MVALFDSRLETPILDGLARGLGGTTVGLAAFPSAVLLGVAAAVLLLLLAWTGGGGGQRKGDEGGELIEFPSKGCQIDIKKFIDQGRLPRPFKT